MLSVHLLGPVEVHRDGVALDLGGPQQRAVIAHLAIDAGRVVSVERLIDRLWGDAPPRTPLGTLQSYVSRLRRAIEPARVAGRSPQVLVSEAPGYVLRVAPEHVDVHRFAAMIADARTAMGAADPARALAAFDTALGSWRGPALAGVGPDDEVRPIVIRLEQERLAAIEGRYDALLALGRHAEAAPALQEAVGEHPLRERLWAQLALALYRCSRQADALRALASARSTLLDEFGLDPGPELRELESRILAHDPTLLTAAGPVISAAQPAPAPTPSARVELIGRDVEWARLTGALDTAGTAGSQLVLVEGDPGIGKSTLCDAFLAHAADLGWRTVVGRCVEPGLSPSLWPAAEVVRDLVGQVTVTDAVREMAIYRFATDRTVSGGAPSSVELADQFVALVDALAVGPLVVLLDDLHWADQATLDVATLAVERLAERPIVVVGAFRSPDIVPGSLLGDALGRLVRARPATRIAMSPLDDDGVRQLMELTTGTAPSAEVATRVQQRAGGNPLFVSELARLAGERGLADDAVVPDAIRDVVRGRLAQLPERATAELEVAAVVGERFDLRTVMVASEREPDDCLDALDAAIVTRILVPTGDQFRFAHALVRDAVLAEVSPLRRARLHQRVADAIVTTHGTGPDVAEPIAHHRLAARLVSDPLVVAKAAVRGSDVARWRHALDTADWLAERALEVLADVVHTVETRAVAVEALEAIVAASYRRGGDIAYDALATRTEEYAKKFNSDSAAALSLFLRWGEIDETDDLATVAPAADRARELASRATDPYAIVTVGYMLASDALLRGRLDEAAQHCEVALAAAGAPGPDDRPDHVPLVLLPVIAGVTSALRGDADVAREHAYRRAPAWLSQRSEVDTAAHAALAFNRALVEALLDAPDAVLAELSDGVGATDSGLFSHQDAACELLTGWARARTGEPEGADAALTALTVIEQGTERTLTACFRAFVADALMARGDDTAVGHLARARSEAERRGEVWWLSEIVRLQAEADAAFDGGRRTVELLDEADRIASVQGVPLIAERVAATRLRLLSTAPTPAADVPTA